MEPTYGQMREGGQLWAGPKWPSANPPIEAQDGRGALAVRTGSAVERKAFVCKSCGAVYADNPVTECDCARGARFFYEGTIRYIEQPNSGNQP